MSETINIGRTIARERRSRDITQEALAAHLGVSKAAVSKWELGQSLPDVSLLPRIAAYFSLTLDELFDWRDALTEEESAALYAEVYALGERDLRAAHERLRALAAEHYSDANLLLMLASLLTMWAAGMATPFTPAQGEGEAGAESMALIDETLTLLDRVLEIATDPSTIFLAQQQKAATLFQVGRYGDAAALLEPLVRRQDAGAPTMLLASAYRKLGREGEARGLLQAERLRAANFVLSALAHAVEAAESVSARPDASGSPLWDCVAERFDPARSGAAWAEHKERQADELRCSVRRMAAELTLAPAWGAFAGDDARYQEIAGAAARLSGKMVMADVEA